MRTTIEVNEQVQDKVEALANSLGLEIEYAELNDGFATLTYEGEEDLIDRFGNELLAMAENGWED